MVAVAVVMAALVLADSEPVLGFLLLLDLLIPLLLALAVQVVPNHPQETKVMILYFQP